MVLIACPECSTEVSSAAPSCPKCGYPVAQAVERVRSKMSVGPSESATDEKATRWTKVRQWYDREVEPQFRAMEPDPQESQRELRKRNDKRDWGRLAGAAVVVLVIVAVVDRCGRDPTSEPVATVEPGSQSRGWVEGGNRPSSIKLAPGRRRASPKTRAEKVQQIYWTDASEDEYRQHCQGGRCKLQSFYVLGVERYKGNVFVAFGDAISEKRFDGQLRNPKTAKLYGPNFVATVTCQPPYKRIKDPDTELYFRNCRHNPKVPPWDMDAEMAEHSTRMANRSKFSFTVEGYDGNMLYGYRKFLGETMNFAIKLNNASTAARLPSGWTVYVVCFDEMQLHSTQIGPLRKHSDCNQLRGERP